MEIEEIRQHLQSLKQQSWLSPAQRWWPDFLFHCTDVRNVVNILQNGEMLSRRRARASGQLHVDIASPDVIARTNQRWQDYVRLYFRPKTPTQFQIEGFRPPEHQPYGVQCPVPVYLLFGAAALLSRARVLFTNGNVANGAQPTNDLDFLKTIPFEMVYHSMPVDHVERDRIVYHRHAEVLVPERLSTSAILFLRCRSQAEYETLLSLLPPHTLTQWSNKIGVSPKLDLFSRQWCFVEQVEMNRESVLFRFNTGDSRNPSGPFRARAEIIETLTDSRLVWSDDNFVVRPAFRLRLNCQQPQDYTIKFWLDDQLAYSGKYQEELLPF